MKIEECQVLLSGVLPYCSVNAPETTPLGRAGASIVLMSRSYESDGRGFYAGGDQVNALASYWYAFGWIHFGISYGIVSYRGKTTPCIFNGPFEQIPPELKEKLAEKTGRYALLLETARSSVAGAPDTSTPAHAFAGTVLCITGAYLKYGNLSRKAGLHEKALACFSYGHGWLDAGVTAGLFSIHANREIFTV